MNQIRGEQDSRRGAHQPSLAITKDRTGRLAGDSGPSSLHESMSESLARCCRVRTGAACQAGQLSTKPAQTVGMRGLPLPPDGELLGSPSRWPSMSSRTTGNSRMFLRMSQWGATIPDRESAGVRYALGPSRLPRHPLVWLSMWSCTQGPRDDSHARLGSPGCFYAPPGSCDST